MTLQHPPTKRRTVVKGIAWTAPAIVMTQALPAYAASCLQSCASINTALKFGTAGQISTTAGTANWGGTGAAGAGWFWSQNVASGCTTCGTFASTNCWSGQASCGDQRPVSLSNWVPNSGAAKTRCGSLGGTCAAVTTAASGTIVLFGGDPKNTLTNTMMFTSGTFCLRQGIEYRVRFNTSAEACSGNPITLTAAIIPATASQTFALTMSPDVVTAGIPNPMTVPNGSPSWTNQAVSSQWLEPSSNVGTYRLRFTWSFPSKPNASCDFNDLGFSQPVVECRVKGTNTAYP